MKVLVTGGAGFIGSHLVDQLVKLEYDVHVIDNFSTGKRDFLSPHAHLYEFDIRGIETRQWIQEEKPDVIFHLAAQADVSKSMEDPKVDNDTNINGTINILEACRNHDIKKLIFSSTSAVYGNIVRDRISEKDLAKPVSFYGLSKRTAETYIQLFSHQYDIPFTILRYGNVYGPRQTVKGEGGVIAVFLDQLKKQKPLNIHGDGEQTRDFIFVKDIVQANLAAIERGNRDIFNISTAQSTSVNQIVNILTQLHKQPVLVRYSAARKGDI
ncbi:MAG: NAD-dependent epimerase/dehydratase family protein [Caldibacillus thermoamylovorans]